MRVTGSNRDNSTLPVPRVQVLVFERDRDALRCLPCGWLSRMTLTSLPAGLASTPVTPVNRFRKRMNPWCRCQAKDWPISYRRGQSAPQTVWSCRIGDNRRSSVPARFFIIDSSGGLRSGPEFFDFSSLTRAKPVAAERACTGIEYRSGNFRTRVCLRSQATVSITGTTYRAGEAGAQATAQSERMRPWLVANRFQAVSQASMRSARLRNTELASQWLRT